MREIIVIAHNIRSTHNVGSLLRTSEGLGITKVYFTGYTPYPLQQNDTRMPHIARKLHNQISKTALGAENSQSWEMQPDIMGLIKNLKTTGYTVIALEQATQSIALPSYKPPKKIAVVLGREVEGLEKEILKLCDEVVEIPMDGQKESFNVVQAAAMALYHCRYSPFA